MYQSKLENGLIYTDIVDVMGDFVALQPDIESRVVKSAQLMAQNMDLKPIIKKENLDRIISDEELTGDDLTLLELITPALCYFTYARLLLNFQGSYTDSGFTTDQLETSLAEAQKVSSRMRSLGDTAMLDVVEFLEEENPETEVTTEKITKGIRVFGGVENRASN